MHCYVFVALFELRGAFQYIVCGVRFAIYYIYILCLVSICVSPILVEGLWKFELFGFLIVFVQLTSHALFFFSFKTCWGLWNMNNSLDLGFFFSLSLLTSLGSFYKERLIWATKPNLPFWAHKIYVDLFWEAQINMGSHFFHHLFWLIVFQLFS